MLVHIQLLNSSGNRVAAAPARGYLVIKDGVASFYAIAKPDVRAWPPMRVVRLDVRDFDMLVGGLVKCRPPVLPDDDDDPIDGKPPRSPMVLYQEWLVRPDWSPDVARHDAAVEARTGQPPQ